MPNCDFYAVPEDHKHILNWLFASKACMIYELASQFEKPLREFRSAEEVLDQFSRTYANGENWHTVHLQVNVVNASPPFVPKRVSLNPEKCGGATFRYAAEGLGLVQLYLAAPTPKGLNNSHTNHNSEKRAKAWAPIRSDMTDFQLWDFKKISAFSASLNRQVKKLSAARIGSRPVLPGALEQWRHGRQLLPFQGEAAKVEIY